MPTGIIPNTDIELNLLSGAHWSRTTIADGKWLNSNTIQPLFNNDCILASAIHDTSADLYNRLSDASGELQGEIDVINAGSDVIDVLGSYQDLMNYQSWTTDRDVIKILNDETHSGEQTYYRYSGESEYSGTFDPDPSRWNFVGELAPYYNKTEIDGKINVINNTINNVSSTINGEIEDTSAILHDEILTSADNLYRIIQETSGKKLETSGNHIALVESENKMTIESDASQILAAPDGVTTPIDLFIRPDRSGYDITGSGVSGFIPSIPPKAATGIDRLVLGKDGSDSGSNFGWIESDVISKTLRPTTGPIDSTTRQHELDFEIATYRGSPIDPLQVSVSTYDESGIKTDYGKLIPPTSGYEEKSIRIDDKGRVQFTEDSINYLEHTQYEGDKIYHNIHLCGYWGEASGVGGDKTVLGDSFGVSADNGFRGYRSWVVWPMNNNGVGEGVTKTEELGGVKYINNGQSFSQDGNFYSWKKKIPTLFEYYNQNGGANGTIVNQYYKLPTESGKYPKFVHGSGMFKVPADNELHIIPCKTIDTTKPNPEATSIDSIQNYNTSSFVPNQWYHVSFDFSRSEGWNDDTDYGSDLRYIAIKGTANSTSNIEVENIRFLCWY